MYAILLLKNNVNKVSRKNYKQKVYCTSSVVNDTDFYGMKKRYTYLRQFQFHTLSVYISDT